MPRPRLASARSPGAPRLSPSAPRGPRARASDRPLHRTRPRAAQPREQESATALPAQAKQGRETATALPAQAKQERSRSAPAGESTPQPSPPRPPPPPPPPPP